MVLVWRNTYNPPHSSELTLFSYLVLLSLCNADDMDSCPNNTFLRPFDEEHTIRKHLSCQLQFAAASPQGVLYSDKSPNTTSSKPLTQMELATYRFALSTRLEACRQYYLASSHVAIHAARRPRTTLACPNK